MGGAKSKLRGFLVLARVSNLPTVWSNCLAGWLLADGHDWPFWALALTCIGTSFLYTGGMFLNDAFDAEFDREFRSERPIPSGLVSVRTAWVFGAVFLLLGFLVLAGFGLHTTLFSVLLIALIIAYDALHKKTILSPLLMGVCRFLLYLIAASVAGGVTGFILWHATVLALYIVGLSYIAKTESAPGPLRYWPVIFLASPIVLAWIVNDFSYRQNGLLLSGVFAAWTFWSLRHLFRAKHKSIGAAVSGLLAGIVFVDWLAVGELNSGTVLAFAGLFFAARLFQKFIPAT